MKDDEKAGLRELENLIRSLQVEMSNLESDQRRIEERVAERDLRLRIIKKETESLRLEREELSRNNQKDKHKLFSIQEGLRLAKKRLQEKLAQKRAGSF